MDLLVIDDSVQKKPSRRGMGRLVAVGGMHIPSASVRALEHGIENLCQRTGFPKGQEFKWSPHRKTWMHKELRGETRTRFFRSALTLVGEAGATAFVVIEDATRKPAMSDSGSPEVDVVRLMLERGQNHLRSIDSEAMVIADHPAGGRPGEERFLAECIRTMREGTTHVVPDRIALAVTADSKSVRLIQLADVIVGCSLSFVSGMRDYAPAVFPDHIKPLLCDQMGRRGGVGLKIHPAGRYRNLYHWLLGDTHLGPQKPDVVLPAPGSAYHLSADAP